MTQCERLHEWLSSGQTITCLEAWDSLGISFVGRRVYDLRKAGIQVKDRWITVENRWREEVRVKEYYLEEPEIVVDDKGYSFDKSLAEAKERSPQLFMEL
jgi:hypothetical protein